MTMIKLIFVCSIIHLPSQSSDHLDLLNGLGGVADWWTDDDIVKAAGNQRIDVE